MSESKAKRVEIKDVDGQTLTKLVDYVYTAEIEVTEENVQYWKHTFADLHTCTELQSQANAYAGLSSVEAYSSKSNEWFFVSPMNTRRSSVGVGVVEDTLQFYCGGQGSPWWILSAVQQPLACGGQGSPWWILSAVQQPLAQCSSTVGVAVHQELLLVSTL
ncbi:UNVERIFIED_CONTAM: hypothetical protein FKN15_055010 [Acipenser sinensis]